MKLSNITIQNFRSIENLSVDLPGHYTAISGKNNSGKSNLLRPLKILFEPEQRFRFSDEEIKHSLVSSAEKLRVNPATQVGMVIPYTCFIAEYLSKDYREKEERDVCISVDGDVFINSIAGLHNDSKLLGNFRQ